MDRRPGERMLEPTFESPRDGAAEPTTSVDDRRSGVVNHCFRAGGVQKAAFVRIFATFRHGQECIISDVKSLSY